jgi:hypothetical protein
MRRVKTLASVLDLIGDTPIVRVNHFDTGPCELFIKLESQNPGGSIKDRIGLKMIEDAEERGLIKPGSTLVEGTAGNTGLGLALVAASILSLLLPVRGRNTRSFGVRHPFGWEPLTMISILPPVGRPRRQRGSRPLDPSPSGSSCGAPAEPNGRLCIVPCRRVEVPWRMWVYCSAVCPLTGQGLFSQSHRALEAGSDGNVENGCGRRLQSFVLVHFWV